MRCSTISMLICHDLCHFWIRITKRFEQRLGVERGIFQQLANGDGWPCNCFPSRTFILLQALFTFVGRPRQHKFLPWPANFVRCRRMFSYVLAGRWVSGICQTPIICLISCWYVFIVDALAHGFERSVSSKAAWVAQGIVPVWDVNTSLRQQPLSTRLRNGHSPRLSIG